MELVVDDEEVLGQPVFGGGGRLDKLDRVDPEELAIDFVHGEQGGRHAA